jgi:hypothetical protein
MMLAAANRAGCTRNTRERNTPVLLGGQSRLPEHCLQVEFDVFGRFRNGMPKLFDVRHD